MRVGQGWISPKLLDSGQWKVCHWSLVADEGYSITIQITELNLRPKFRGDCLLNVIKVCIGATARARLRVEVTQNLHLIIGVGKDLK